MTVVGFLPQHKVHRSFCLIHLIHNTLAFMASEVEFTDNSEKSGGLYKRDVLTEVHPLRNAD